MASHFIKRCECGRVLAQCRCPGPKTETVVPCVCRDPYVAIPCLHCGAKLTYAPESREARGEFNSFCSNGECEDRYAAKP
jgi:hypothetical protein